MSVVLAECRESIGQVAVKSIIGCRPTCVLTKSRPICRLTVGPHIGQGCQPTEAFITHDPFFFWQGSFINME